MPPELDIDRAVDGIVDDLFPKQELDEEIEDTEKKEEHEEVVEEVVEDPKPRIEEPDLKGKIELKPGDKDYVAPEVVTAPTSWSKELHPEYAKLAKPVRDYIAKREEDYTKGITQYKQSADYGNAVHAIVQPYTAHITARGSNVGDTLKFLLNADYLLAQGTPEAKTDFIRQVMTNAGVTAEMLGAEPVKKDPAVAALEKQIGELRGTLTATQQAQLNEQNSKISKAVDTFAADPKNLYFAELSDDIVKLINAGYTLEESYEKAMWANPLTRAKEQARVTKDTNEARTKAAREAAEKARKAARSNVKETPSSRSAPTGLLGSMDDTIRSTLRTINERTS